MPRAGVRYSKALAPLNIWYSRGKPAESCKASPVIAVRYPSPGRLFYGLDSCLVLEWWYGISGYDS